MKLRFQNGRALITVIEGSEPHEREAEIVVRGDGTFWYRPRVSSDEFMAWGDGETLHVFRFDNVAAFRRFVGLQKGEVRL